ncbi:type 3 dihydrofolate reductase [Psychrobium sp. nBUS_13]|uniref:type 3 dihydrofolate reductase n=1 Tax=Psychrobium sp. nBUS_13 TaxID=3395319 RepID=UPI003EBC9D1D
MKIAMIAAMAKNRVIGKDNKMPWHLPEELAYFKKITMGKPIVMGRNTFESIGRPLPGRQNIVVSRNSELSIEGVTVVNSIDEAISAADNCEELMIIGGAMLYEHMLPKADVLYLTEIELDVDGDAYFPDYNQHQWLKSDVEVHHSKSGLLFNTFLLVKA